MISLPMSEMVGLIEEVISGDGEFRLYPRGTSMLPLIRQGKDSVILVKPGLLSIGDIILYKRNNGQFVLHRIVKIKGDDLVICGDNQTALEYGITVFDVIAKVKAVYIDETRYEGVIGDKGKHYLKNLWFKRKFKPQFIRLKRVIKNPSLIWRKIKGEK